MKDYAVAFGVPNSHGCIFNVPQVGGFFRVVLRIWGSFAGYKRSEKSPKNTKMRSMEDNQYGRTAVYHDQKGLRGSEETS